MANLPPQTPLAALSESLAILRLVSVRFRRHLPTLNQVGRHRHEDVGSFYMRPRLFRGRKTVRVVASVNGNRTGSVYRRAPAACVPCAESHVPEVNNHPRRRHATETSCRASRGSPYAGRVKSAEQPQTDDNAAAEQARHEKLSRRRSSGIGLWTRKHEPLSALGRR